jgi:hypothetical protein
MRQRANLPANRAIMGSARHGGRLEGTPMTFAATSLAILLWLAVPGAAHADELVEVAGHRAAIAPERADATPPLLGFRHGTLPGGDPAARMFRL